MPGHSAVWRFAVRVLAWLAPALLAWYLAAPWYDPLPTWLARGILGVYRAGLVLGVDPAARMLTFVTSIPAESERAGWLVVEVNPLLYTYGSALFLALMMASRASWKRVALGLLVLLPFQAWGIAFDLVAALIRANLVQAAGLAGWRAQVGALLYQLGSIILPTIVPVVAWGALERRFIEELALRRTPA
ncbi:MAG TPA: exosortase H-associated membrane protein [Usitatibacter sp.]|nr:exosortase H-associated membrane protein [Usitatibacter sp.]